MDYLEQMACFVFVALGLDHNSAKCCQCYWLSAGETLVPQLTIVTPPKPKFHYFVACLPIVPSSWQGV